MVTLRTWKRLDEAFLKIRVDHSSSLKWQQICGVFFSRNPIVTNDQKNNALLKMGSDFARVIRMQFLKRSTKDLVYTHSNCVSREVWHPNFQSHLLGFVRAKQTLDTTTYSLTALQIKVCWFSGLFGESFPRHRNHSNHRSRAAFGAFHPSWIVHARDSSWKVKQHGDVVKLENLEKILKAQNCSKLSCSDQLSRNIWWHDTPWYVYYACIPAGLRRKSNLADP